MTHNPYAEDYANAMKDPDSPTARYHREHYGSAPYSDFTRQFEAGLTKWDPDRWASQFKAAGASYIVVTAKYADGYSLWPTKVRNPHAPEFHAKRDLMGELAAAVRKQGLKFGVYYSGGVDWTFQKDGEDARRLLVPALRRGLPPVRRGPGARADRPVQAGHPLERHLLADRFQTPLLGHRGLLQPVPEGVVDDRWSTASFGRQVMGLKPLRWGFDQLMRGLFKLPDVADSMSTPREMPHSDFRTPEYAAFDSIQTKFWQQDRGIGRSFGYNRTEGEADYTKSSELIAELAKASANNGALLLNVGPSGGEGEDRPEQLSRLTDIGAWLKTNGEAYDGSRPWTQSSARARPVNTVTFTWKAGAVYATVLGRPKGDIVIQGITLTEGHPLGRSGRRTQTGGGSTTRSRR